MSASTPLLEVQGLSVHFPIKSGLLSPPSVLKAVDGVSFNIEKGETLGLVGESGCGKTTTGRAILRLCRATAGQVIFAGEDILSLPPKALPPLRQQMQIIFQDPYSSLNPRLTVGDTVGEPLEIHKTVPPGDRKTTILELLAKVGLSPTDATRYPHELSSGQRQRVGIARALALNPSFIVCDEPVSALDVSIQAQIINLLLTLKEERGLSYLFISHDLSLVRYISDRVAVMYMGKIVEITLRDELFKNPAHPYTKELLAAGPFPGGAGVPSTTSSKLIPAAGGCLYAGRCPLAGQRCLDEEPKLKDIGGGHCAACHYTR